MSDEFWILQITPPFIQNITLSTVFPVLYKSTSWGHQSLSPSLSSSVLTIIPVFIYWPTPSCLYPSINPPTPHAYVHSFFTSRFFLTQQFNRTSFLSFDLHILFTYLPIILANVVTMRGELIWFRIGSDIRLLGHINKNSHAINFGDF